MTQLCRKHGHSKAARRGAPASVPPDLDTHSIIPPPQHTLAGHQPRSKLRSGMAAPSWLCSLARHHLQAAHSRRSAAAIYGSPGQGPSIASSRTTKCASRGSAAAGSPLPAGRRSARTRPAALRLGDPLFFPTVHKLGRGGPNYNGDRGPADRRPVNRVSNRSSSWVPPTDPQGYVLIRASGEGPGASREDKNKAEPWRAARRARGPMRLGNRASHLCTTINLAAVDHGVESRWGKGFHERGGHEDPRRSGRFVQSPRLTYSKLIKVREVDNGLSSSPELIKNFSARCWRDLLFPRVSG